MSPGDIGRLQELSKNDATIATFFRRYGQGEFSTFEEMVIRLAVQLSIEKKAIRKQLTDVIKERSSPTIFGLNMESGNEERRQN